MSDIRDPEEFIDHVNNEHGMNFFGGFFNATRGYHAYLHAQDMEFYDHTHPEEQLNYTDDTEPR